MKRSLLTALAVMAALGATRAEEDEVIAKFREALRTSMLQLREAQAQIATLQASEIAKDQEIAKLKADIKKIADQAIEDKNTAANTISALREDGAKKNASIAGYLRALEKWKQDFGKLTENYRKTAAERDKLQTKSIALERKVADQQFKNVEMYQVGIELLDRYERFWFGDALLAREPFSGIARTRLENIIQQGEDKLLAARIVDTGKLPEPTPSPSPDASPAASPAPSPTPSPAQQAKPPETPQPTPKPKKQRRGEKPETAWPQAQPAS